MFGVAEDEQAIAREVETGRENALRRFTWLTALLIAAAVCYLYRVKLDDRALAAARPILDALSS